MTRAFITVTPDTCVADARRLALARGVRHLPVLDGGTLVGMVCLSDLREATDGGMVSEYMSEPVVTVRGSASLAEAAEAMRQLAVSCLPVVSGNLVLGVVTHTDLERGPARAPGRWMMSAERASALRLRVNLRTVLSDGGEVARASTVYCPRRLRSLAVDECVECEHSRGMGFDPPAHASFIVCAGAPGDPVATSWAAVGETHPRLPPVEVQRTPVAAVMSRDVVCVTAGMSVEALAVLLLDRGISGAPVVDAAGRPVGVVSKTDLLRERDAAAATVGDVMTSLAFTLDENTPLGQAAALMAFEGVHRLPIVNRDGTVVGILATLDVLRWIAERDGYLIGTRR